MTTTTKRQRRRKEKLVLGLLFIRTGDLCARVEILDKPDLAHRFWPSLARRPSRPNYARSLLKRVFFSSFICIVLLANQTNNGIKSDVRTLILGIFASKPSADGKQNKNVNANDKTAKLPPLTIQCSFRSISTREENTYRIRLKNGNSPIDISNIYPLFQRIYNDVMNDTTTTT